MRKTFLAMVVGVAIAALIAASGLLIAQPVTQNTISGNECWSAGQGPGGPSSFLCINLVRNGTALTLISGSGAQTFTATQANSTVFWTGTAPTSLTITLPSPAFDGEMITVATDTVLTTLVTIVAGSGQSMNLPFNSATIAANSSVEYQFSAVTSKWYRQR